MEPIQPEFFQNLTAEELVEARREKLQHLELWDKLNTGQLYKVTVSDVDQLFAIFDVEGSGEISMEELMEIKKVQGLLLTSADIAALGKDADKDGSGLISVNELYKAFIQGEVAYNLIKKSINEESAIQQLGEGECLIDDLIEWMRMEYDINADLWSLPQTLLLFCVFIYSASSHLPIRYGWEIAENYAAASKRGAVRTAAIYDYVSLTDYLTKTWVDQHLHQDLKLYTPGRYFGRNQIVGGYRFRRFHTLPQNCSIPAYMERVYYPFPLLGVKCYKTGQELTDDRFVLYHERQDIARAEVDSWTYEYWLDDNTTSLSIDSVIYNPIMGTFTFEQVVFKFENSGFIRQIQFAETFLAEPYKDWSSAVPDVLLIGLLFRILYSEMKELLPALSIGFDGIMNYLQFWNVVDWLAIFWGVLCAALWCFFCLQLAGVQPSIENIPLPLMDAIVQANRTYMASWEVSIILPRKELEQRLAQMFDTCQGTATWHEAVRILCALYLFVLMLKFFKSFKANARLNVVITTLSGSVKDVSHFGIVFLTIFLCYAWSGHVFFGKEIEGCSTILGAVFWRWTTGVGISDMEDLDVVGRALGYAYTLSYEFLVLNLLFGILFGLIFESYGRTMEQAGDPATVLEQIQKAIKEMRKKKDFLDDWYTICNLIDDDAPAHPAEIVTVKSLCQAFERDNMSKANAEYLIHNVREYELAKTSEVEVSLLDALRLVARMRTTSLRSINVTEDILAMLKAESQKPQEMRFRCIMAGFDPDAPGDMQEFIRMSTLQSLEEDNPVALPLPGQVPSTGPVQKSESKATVNSHSIEGTKEEAGAVEEDRSELEAKEKQIIVKLGILQDAALEMQSDARLRAEKVEEEIRSYHAQAQAFDQEQQARRKELTSHSCKAQEGGSKLADRFQDSDLHALQDLPERIFRLAQLAKASRKAVESGKPGFGSDPLKRLEQCISMLLARCQQYGNEAEAQNDIKALLRRVITQLEEMLGEPETPSLSEPGRSNTRIRIQG